MPTETFFNLPDEKRNHIIQVAIKEFIENEYQAASVSRIVAKAGIAKGSFYQYFADKADLHQYLFDLIAQEKSQFLSTTPPDPQIGIFAYIRWLAKEGAVFEAAHPQLSQFGYQAIRGSGLPAEFSSLIKAQTQSLFKQLVVQGKEHGDIDLAVDDDLAAFIFMTIFNELGRYMMSRVAVDEEEMLADGRSFFDSVEMKTILEQTLQILEYGMRNLHSGETS